MNAPIGRMERLARPKDICIHTLSVSEQYARTAEFTCAYLQQCILNDSSTATGLHGDACQHSHTMGSSPAPGQQRLETCEYGDTRPAHSYSGYLFSLVLNSIVCDTYLG